MSETYEEKALKGPMTGKLLVEDLPPQDVRDEADSHRNSMRRRVRHLGNRWWLLVLSGIWLVLVLMALPIFSALDQGGSAQMPSSSVLIVFALFQVLVLALAGTVILVGLETNRHRNRMRLRAVSGLLGLFWMVALAQTYWLWSAASVGPSVVAEQEEMAPDESPSTLFHAPLIEPSPLSPSTDPDCAGRMLDNPCKVD